MITKADWTKAGDFMKAIQGQAMPVEIEQAIFDSFMGCVYPEEMGKTRADFSDLPQGLPVQRYFLCGEPYTSDNRGRALYMTFARAFDTKFYYIGLFPTV